MSVLRRFNIIWLVEIDHHLFRMMPSMMVHYSMVEYHKYININVYDITGI